MAGVVHCWERTQLLRAWERTVQVEATSKAKEIFPNLVHAGTVQASVVQDEGSEDLEAGYAGAPFVQPEHEEEWMEWVDWAQVEGLYNGMSMSRCTHVHVHLHASR